MQVNRETLKYFLMILFLLLVVFLSQQNIIKNTIERGGIFIPVSKIKDYLKTAISNGRSNIKEGGINLFSDLF